MGMKRKVSDLYKEILSTVRLFMDFMLSHVFNTMLIKKLTLNCKTLKSQIVHKKFHFEIIYLAFLLYTGSESLSYALMAKNWVTFIYNDPF